MIETTKYSVLCHFEAIGFHCWPKAPDHRAYLRNDHRHLFKFRVELTVEGADREIEVHDLKAQCEGWALSAVGGATKTWSCEQYAEKLLKYLYTAYQQLAGRVECWEDGECGGACEMVWRESKENL